MLSSKHQRRASVTKRLVLPDIEPEDLHRPKPMFAGRSLPKRRSEIKEETVGVE